MRGLPRYLLVACLCFVAGAAFGGWVCLHQGNVGLDLLTERTDARDMRPVVRFDVWSTPDENPAPPAYHAGLSVVPREGESMAVHIAGESYVDLIVCTPEGAVNPCGPEGPRPDTVDTGLVEDHLFGAGPRPLP